MDLTQQLLLVITTQDIDLGHCHCIQPWLDDGPYCRKRPGCIDDVKFAHALGIVILSDSGCLEDVVLDLVKVGQGDAAKVENCARCFDGVSNCLCTCWKAI